MTEELLNQILTKLDGMATKDDIAKLNDKFDNVEAVLSAKIDKLDTRIDSVEAALTARIDSVEDNLTAIIDEVEANLAAKIDKVDAQQQQDIIGMLKIIDKKIDERMDKQDQVIKILSARSIAQEAEIEIFKQRNTA